MFCVDEEKSWLFGTEISRGCCSDSSAAVVSKCVFLKWTLSLDDSNALWCSEPTIVILVPTKIKKSYVMACSVVSAESGKLCIACARSEASVDIALMICVVDQY